MSNRTILFLSVLFALCCVSMSLVYGWMVTSDIEMFKVKMGDGTVASLFCIMMAGIFGLLAFAFMMTFLSSDVNPQVQEDEDESEAS